MEINKIYNENCLDTMSRMPNDFIDLTVTSPPYDNLRNYNGYTFDFESIAHELFRVTKHGGVVVWIVGDTTINGSETGTSFKQALYFKKIGFNLHDTMIYHKESIPTQKNRYQQHFEYMFVMCKGKIKNTNLIKIKCKLYGKKSSKHSDRQKNGIVKKQRSTEFTKKYKIKGNIWKYNVGYMHSTKDKIAYEHPATFPEQLANDHIISWSNPDDLVYDCFTGSGTTAKMCLRNDRNFIGSELSSEYCDIANKRIEETKKIIALEKTQMKLF